ncbi:MAG TPA: SRPBCC family protein [Marmoricola sp.]
MQPAALEDSIEIAASPDVVWALVADPRRMAEWSPQVVSVRLREGHDTIEVGTEFTNRNELGELAWTTHGTVVRLDPGRELAFRIAENWVVWSYTVEPAGEGTLLVERRETPEGISDVSAQWTDKYLGGQEAFTDVMRDGVHRTLEAIKAAAEG